MPNAHPKVTVDRALMMMLFGMTYIETSKAMYQEYGDQIHANTLSEWKNKAYVKRYNELHEEHKEKIEADVIRRMRERLRLVDEAEKLAVDKVIAGLHSDKVSGKDAALAALQMSRVKAQNVDKLMQLTGRPTQIIEDKSGKVTEEVLRELIGSGILREVSHNGDEPDA